MPRYRRQTAPGSVQHVISRFVNREFRLDTEGARREYLRRAGRALAGTDWRAVAFALMSSHVHWVLYAGSRPSASFIKPLHSGFAAWLNASQRRLGPVFADRHRTVTFEGATAAGLVAYVHNNPVRAGVVSNPADCRWTSHRAYLGVEEPPPWLDVALGLRLCGFSVTPAGRAAYAALVVSRADLPRSIELSGGDLEQRRRQARKSTSAPVEIAAPCVQERGHSLELTAAIVVPQGCRTALPWRGCTDAMLDAAARAAGTTPALLRGRGRARDLVAARRLALLTWARCFGRPVVDMARALGIAESSASELISTAPACVHRDASLLARTLLAQECRASDGRAPGAVQSPGPTNTSGPSASR